MKDVLISIKSKQKPPNGDEETIELVTDGQYAFGKNGAVFTYLESPITGLDGTKTTFLVRKNTVSVNRTGTVTSRMLFEEGQKHHFLYELPFGSTTMGIDTKEIRSTLDENGGELEIVYLTNVGHNPLGRNVFLITIREQKERESNG